MNEFKNNIKDNFTAIPNTFINDERLSWKAKGIFLYLASKPNDWEFYMTEIEKNATDGKQSLQSGVKELEQFNYLIRQKAKTEEGTFTGWKWTLTIPISRQSVNPSDGKADRRKTQSYSNKDNTNTNNTNKEEKHYDYVQFVDLWNELNDCNLRITDSKRKQIRARLNTYTEQEIKQAIKNRAQDTWVKDNAQHKNFSALFRNDEKMEHGLTKPTANKIYVIIVQNIVVAYYLINNIIPFY